MTVQTCGTAQLGQSKPGRLLRLTELVQVIVAVIVLMLRYELCADPGSEHDRLGRRSSRVTA
jgi:hypothetical protein